MVFVIVFSFLLVSIHLVDMSEYLEVPKKCITLSCYLFVRVCVCVFKETTNGGYGDPCL